MPELIAPDRLQPSLLDRLTDEAPAEEQESRSKRVISVQQLRSSVQRDLAWLFNTTNMMAGTDLDAYPEVATSVLNYGVPSLVGETLRERDINALREGLREAILNFEPRLLPASLQVSLVSDRDKMNRNALSFGIEAQLWAQPLPVRIYLKTDIDLDLGAVEVTPVSGRTNGARGDGR